MSNLVYSDELSRGGYKISGLRWIFLFQDFCTYKIQKHDRRESQTPPFFFFDLVKKLVGNLAKPPVNHGKIPPSVRFFEIPFTKKMMVVNTTTLSNGRFDRDWRISNDCECIPFFPQPNPGVYTSAPRAWTPAAAAPTQRKSILRRMTLKTRQTRNTRHSLYIGDLRLLTKLKHIDHQKKFPKKKSYCPAGIFFDLDFFFFHP